MTGVNMHYLSFAPALRGRFLQYLMGGFSSPPPCSELKGLMTTDDFNNVMAFLYRLSVQQMLTHLPAQVALVAATGKTANDLHLTFTRHLLIQSHRVTYLTSAEVADRVTQGRYPPDLGPKQ